MRPAVRINPRSELIESPIGPISISELSLAGVPRGAVLVLTSGESLSSGGFHGQATEVLNELAANGYEGIAADFAVVDEDEDGSLEVVRTLLQRLAGRGWRPGQVGLIGYRTSARLMLAASAELGLGAAVSVSPSLVRIGEHVPPADVLEGAPRVRTPWLGICAGNDPRAPGSVARALEEALRIRSPVFAQVVFYPRVTSEFYRRAIEAVEIAASFDCWQRTIEWLNARVEPRPTPLAEAWARRKGLHEAPMTRSSPRDTTGLSKGKGTGDV
jgi:carboxymethylenebutenolidase